ncbi:Myb/SANT-like DNA-binding domain protein [Rhynchospora pubera]|uniref:Myb/SANT-like DNA-binding domain protein n=1 Tax=Rhynchospora pubera TaxID=906938 RepID=A0AAV8D8U5_9POAL|nr:Myb/SANT-like DNA-binding domain protein [Rhynchospora pubera]
MGKRKTSQEDLVTWTHPMDDALIDAFIHQKNIGNRVNGTFTTKALDNILKEVSDKFKDVSFDKAKIKNRMKYIKRIFGPCYDVFKGGLSGFSWNPVTCTWGAHPDVWKDLIKAHPEAELLMNKPVCNYFKLADLFGSDRATEEGSNTAAEIRERNAQERNDCLCDEEIEVHRSQSIEEIDFLVSQNQATLGGYNVDPEVLLNKSSGEGTSKKKQKKKSSEEEENAILKESFKYIADAIKDSIESTAELVKSQQRVNNPIGEVWDYLEELQLDEEVQNDAYIYLIDNPAKLQGFMSCPRRSRKTILLKMLHNAKTV